MTQVRLAEKLQTILTEKHQSQAWLAKESGISSSVISRVIAGEREATREVIESVAGVLGEDPWLLVKGTDAEQRFSESARWVQRGQFEAVAQQLAVYEAKLNDRDEQLQTARASADRGQRRCRELETQLGLLHLQIQRRDADVEDLRVHNQALHSELRAHRQGLSRAVAEISSLRAQLSTLALDLSSARQTSRITAILAGVGAFTGVVTVAHYLTQENDDGDEEDDEEVYDGDGS